MPSDAPSPIHADEVKKIAALAHLELTGDEAERMTRELARVLAYVRQLEEVDVSAVPPTAHVQIERLPLRADDPRASLAHELALREAPVVSQDGFAVPAFVEEG
jgi:aspartyl-tRNA(Asn)/glutamyl-tRNA(Gln) amidotransferase subunit C